MSPKQSSIEISDVLADSMRGNIRVEQEMAQRIAQLKKIAEQSRARNTRIAQGEYGDKDVRDDVVMRALGLAINEMGGEVGEEASVHLPFVLPKADELDLTMCFLDVFGSYAHHELEQAEDEHMGLHTVIVVTNVEQ